MKPHARQTKRQGLILCFVSVALCMVCLRAFSEMSPPANVNVTLTVLPIVELHMSNPNGIVMTTVTAGWMNRTRTSQGSVDIDVKTNFQGTLRCLDTVVLEYNSKSYTVPVGILLSGISSAYYSGNYICLDFEPGNHTGSNAARVSASLSKLWSYGDTPGTYRGTVVVEYVPR